MRAAAVVDADHGNFGDGLQGIGKASENAQSVAATGREVSKGKELRKNAAKTFQP